MKNLIVLTGILFFAGCGVHGDIPGQDTREDQVRSTSMVELTQATFGSGCFWCTEAVFERLDGVVNVVSGYAGGTMENPTYTQISTGKTGHAEVCRIEYDAAKISYTDLLDIFWKSHDPTTLNRQGPDIGAQYRSVIFYHNEQQRQMAEGSKKAMQASGYFNNPIVSEIEPLTGFYLAEEYHQNYFRKNPYAPYCMFVIRPKLQKLDH